MKERPKAPTARLLLGANILELRTSLGLSQEKLSEIAGFHRSYISQVERGLVNVTVDNIQRVADSLSVPVARLFKSPDTKSGC